jgi:hypothetical protein
MTCEDRCQSERRCEYDGGIESMGLVISKWIREWGV